jgi:hypothetical protein
MPSKLIKLLLVSTSLSPILLTRAFVATLHQQWGQAVAYAGAACGLALLCVLVLYAVRTTQRLPLGEVKQLQAADTQIIGFVLTYLLPLARPETTPEDVRVLLFVLLILGLAFWNSNAYHFNPMLGLLGFHFYEATFDRDIKYVLITRKDLYNARGVSHVVRLTEYVVIEAP